jgi:hypothetical protein
MPELGVSLQKEEKKEEEEEEEKKKEKKKKKCRTYDSQNIFFT